MPSRNQRLLIAVGVLTAVACGGSDGTSPKQTNVVGSGGGSVTLASGSVQMNFPAGAVSSTIQVTATPIADPVQDGHTVSGTTYEFGPTGTQFAQPVTVGLKYDPTAVPEGVPASALRLAKNIDGEWHVLEDGLEVDSATKVVHAHLRSFSPYGVVVDPCHPVPPSYGLHGTLTSTDCSPSAGVYEDRFLVPKATVATFQPGSATNSNLYFTDSTGAKVATAAGAPVQVVTGGQTLLVTARNTAAGQTGEYNWVFGTMAGVSFQCANDIYVLPYTSFTADMQSSGACTGTVKVTPYPRALGKPLLLNYYGVYFPAGVHSITLGRLGTNLPLTLTVYSGGKVVAQSVPATKADLATPTRSVSVTASAATLYIIEVSSGVFDDLDEWVNPQGTYSLTVSK